MMFSYNLTAFGHKAFALMQSFELSPFFRLFHLKAPRSVFTSCKFSINFSDKWLLQRDREDGGYSVNKGHATFCVA